MGSHPVIPAVIRVERDPGSGSMRLFIDGEPFPWVFAGDETAPVSIDLVNNVIPTVRISLCARSVEVVDRLLADADLTGTPHENDGPTAAPAAAAEPAATVAGFGVAALQAAAADAPAAVALPVRPAAPVPLLGAGDHVCADPSALAPRCAGCDEPWPCRREQLRAELTDVDS